MNQESYKEYRMVSKIGSYERNGQTKGIYIKLGTVRIQADGGYGFMIPTNDLAAVFVKQRIDNPKKAGDSIMFSLYPNDDRPADNQVAQGGDNQTAEAFDDDIPF